MTATSTETAVDSLKSDVSFDDFAARYDADLALGLQATGEHKQYFIRRRLTWLRENLMRIGFHPGRVLDYGCGCGDSCPVFFEELSIKSYVGVDVSQASLKLAEARHAAAQREFHEVNALRHLDGFDLAYCNGVFHHIEPALRLTALLSVIACLRPGGVFAFWENNPWNPGTRWVMSRIPFDRNAIVLTAREAKELLRQAGFDVLSTSYQFIFPRQLRWLRPIETALAGVPIGGQFQVLARRPEA